MKQMRREFLESVVVYGMPPGPAVGVLAQWYRRLRKTPRPEQLGCYGRVVNRFRVAVNAKVTCVGDAKVYWPGFVRLSERPEPGRWTYDVCTAFSRRVLDVVGGVGEGLAWLQGRVPGDLHDGGDCEMVLERRGGHRSEELRALELARDLLHKCGMLRINRARCSLTGAGGGRGFRFRCGAGWCGGPEGLFVVTTVFKLAVFAPRLLEGEYEPGTKLRNLLAWFKGVDDDARMAYWLVVKDQVKFGHMRPLWGLDKVAPQGEFLNPGPPVLPRATTQAQLLKRFVKGTALALEAPDVPPTVIPAGWTGIQGVRGCGGLACSGVEIVLGWGFGDNTAMLVPAEFGLRTETLRRLEKLLGGRVAVKTGGRLYVAASVLKQTGMGRRLRTALKMLPCVREVPITDAAYCLPKRESKALPIRTKILYGG